MQVFTGRKRKDGTYARRYVCPSQSRDRSADACLALRIDADMVEAMFVSMIPVLFGDDEPTGTVTETFSTSSPGSRLGSPERQQVIDAVLAGDEQAIDGSLELLLARSTMSLPQQLAMRSSRARQIEVAEHFETWAKTGISNPTEDSRSEAARLNGVLRTWLSRVTIARDGRTLSIKVDHQPSSTRRAQPSVVSFSRTEWHQFSPVAQRTSQPHVLWDKASIVAALHQWDRAHGHAPRAADWVLGGIDHPNARTVRRHFSQWRGALRAARLAPANPRAARRWHDEEIISSLTSWASRHGRPPRWEDWRRCTSRRPSGSTVSTHFGSWTAALAAAGLEPAQ